MDRAHGRAIDADKGRGREVVWRRERKHDCAVIICIKGNGWIHQEKPIVRDDALREERGAELPVCDLGSESKVIDNFYRVAAAILHRRAKRAPEMTIDELTRRDGIRASVQTCNWLVQRSAQRMETIFLRHSEVREVISPCVYQCHL